jgi:hypothetical protein
MYEIKLAHKNYSIYGIYKDNELQVSLTPIDFYELVRCFFDFFKKEKNYKIPKLYPCNLDLVPDYKCILRETWGNKYMIEFTMVKYRRLGFCGYTYGEHNKEELEKIFNAIENFLETNDHCLIFDCRSDDVSNYGFNPYTFYKDLYPKTDLKIEDFFYFILSGYWHYTSKTLKENIDFIHENYEGKSNVLSKEPFYQLMKMKCKHFVIGIGEIDWDDKDYSKAFSCLNYYKNI